MRLLSCGYWGCRQGGTIKNGIDQETNISSDADAGYRVWLYDVDGEDAPSKVADFNPSKLGDEQIMWVDVDLSVAGQLDRLWDELSVDEKDRRSIVPGDRPTFVRQRDFLQLNVLVVRQVEDGFEPVGLHCLVSKNWIVTLHAEEIDLADKFNEPLVGETHLGRLDGPAFLSVVLEWQLSGYFAVIEGLQMEIDRLDEELLKATRNRPALLEHMLDMRRRVTALRRALGPHRDIFSLLSHPESEALIGSESAEIYARLEKRLDRALGAVASTREMIAGSFDIFMTQTSHTTNEIMKRLTLVSVLLLPAVVLAGIMGMNFKVGLFEKSWMFGVTLGIMAALAIATLMVARKRGWV